MDSPLREDRILPMYTACYDDYRLPGGGIDAGEDQVQGLIRELREQKGVRGVRNVRESGSYENFRPCHKADAAIMHMISYCYF